MDGVLLKSLRTSIERQQAIIIAGAGVSVAASDGHSCASWQGLLRDGFEYVKQVNRNLTDSWLRSIRERIEDDDPTLWVGAAYEIEEKLKSVGEFGNWLNDSIGGITPVNPSIIDALDNLGVPIATTNYDGILHRHLGCGFATWKNSAQVLAALRDGRTGRQSIIHLHGHYQEEESVVFSVQSYGALLGSHAQEIQHAMALIRTMIFIGYGAGLQDPNFGSLGRWLGGVTGTPPTIRHYRLMRDGESVPEGSFYRSISYGSNYSDLIGFLEELAPQQGAAAYPTALHATQAGQTQRTGETRATKIDESRLEPFCAVASQIDFTPQARTPGSAPLSSDPMLNVQSKSDFTLSHLVANFPRLDQIVDLPKKFQEQYEAELGKKLEYLIQLAIDTGVDLIVLPRAVLPVSCAEVCVKFSDELCIVAGLGVLGARDAEILGDLLGGRADLSGARGAECVLVSGPQGTALLTNDDSQFCQMHTNNSAISASTAHGWNYLLRVEAGTEREPSDPWALAATIEGESPVIHGSSQPISLTILSTQAKVGGTRAVSNGTEAEESIVSLPRELDAGVEGLAGISIAWSNRGYDVAPALNAIVYPSMQSPLHALLQKGREAARQGEPPTYAEVLDQVTSDAGSRGVKTVEQALRYARRCRDDLTPEAEALLWTHCILPGELMTRAERIYQQLLTAANLLYPELKREPGLSDYFRAFREAATHLKREVRPELLEVDDQQKLGLDEAQQHIERDLYGELIFAATLGAYSSESAIAVLDKGLRLLQLIASEPDVLLQYRIVTNEIANAEDLSAAFFIICTTRPGLDRKRVEELRGTVGNQLSVTFHGSYAVAYTDGTKELPWSTLLQATEWGSPTGVLGLIGEVEREPQVCDSALLVDFLRSHSSPAAITISCQAATPLEGEPTRSNGTAKMESLTDELHRKLVGLELANARDTSRLKVSVTVQTRAGDLSGSLGTVIGLNACGLPGMTIVEQQAETVNPWALPPTFTLAPAVALRFVHPPVGELYRTSTDRRQRMSGMPAELAEFPSGASFGRAAIRTSSGDRVVEARLSDEDRFRHVYVVGKPGVGKTTLLKSLVRQDIERGHGVTVIDPHGELVEAIAAIIPAERLPEVVLVDLESSEALPVINPLDLPPGSRSARDRAIQEILQFVQHRVYHEFSGPRFEQISRLVLKSMLDDGYPVAPAITEVSPILGSEDLRSSVQAIVRDPLLREDWRALVAQSSAPDFHQVLAWVTAKFDELTSDSSLRAVVGGSRTTINIEEIVRDGGILLVRLPEFSVGERAAAFIGSMILARLRRATFVDLKSARSRPPHFVYMDEFHRFAIEGFDRMIAEARKFRVGFTLAHQNIDQLRQFDPRTGVTTHQLIGSILGNAGTLVAFQVGPNDAEFIAQYIGCRSALFGELGPYQAIASFSLQGQQSEPFLLSPADVPVGPTESAMADLRRRMRNLGLWHGISDIDAELRKRLRRIEGEDS
ncbi:SIR2 family protein [Kitasatospora sp. NPDC057692]|uniref:SIR2 family protein n=1 Tax=Kitasatospora sp. NPDC057692 TaxID=3346215 RepID=UPI00368019C8